MCSEFMAIRGGYSGGYRLVPSSLWEPRARHLRLRAIKRDIGNERSGAREIGGLEMFLHSVVAESHVVRILRCEPKGGGVEEVLTFYNKGDSTRPLRQASKAFRLRNLVRPRLQSVREPKGLRSL